MSEMISDCTTYNFAADELRILKKYMLLVFCMLTGLLSDSVVAYKIKNHLFLFNLLKRGELYVAVYFVEMI